MMTETQLQRELCDWLHSRGYFFWRQNNIPVFGRALPKYTPRGLPDIFILHAGKLYGIEVKRPSAEGEREANGRALRKGMLTPSQAAFGYEIEDNGGVFACVRSLDDLRRVLPNA
jgi:hypothetical protein